MTDADLARPRHPTRCTRGQTHDAVLVRTVRDADPRARRAERADVVLRTFRLSTAGCLTSLCGAAALTAGVAVLVVCAWAKAVVDVMRGRA